MPIIQSTPVLDLPTVAHLHSLPGEGPEPEPPPVVAWLMADVPVLDWGDDALPWAQVEIVTFNEQVNAAHRDGILCSLVAQRSIMPKGMTLTARIRYEAGTVDLICRATAGCFRLEAM